MSFPDLPERWSSIPGYEGQYEVSTIGRVRSLDRKAGARRLHGQVLKASIRPKDRYRSVHLWSHGRKSTNVVHRLVALAFLGSPEEDCYEVCHADGDNLNNCLSNLRWATHSDNIRDTVRHGRHPQAKKTHCVRGHEFTEANTKPQQGGRGRACRECANLRRRKGK